MGWSLRRKKKVEQDALELFTPYSFQGAMASVGSKPKTIQERLRQYDLYIGQELAEFDDGREAKTIYYAVTDSDESVGIFPLVLSPFVDNLDELTEWLDTIEEVFQPEWFSDVKSYEHRGHD
jgi:hypothetical protein